MPLFGDLGKKFANEIEHHAEDAVGKYLESKEPQSTEKASEHMKSITSSGRRKALFVGINYFGQQSELKGCINDVKNIQTFLMENYKIDEVLVLTDDQTKDPSKMPTRANILAGFEWLRKDAKAGDSLIFHYSGHGGLVKDTKHNHETGFDEVIFPYDHEKNGHILDDEIHDVLIKGLPTGVRLTSFIDACHSETMLDLPYTYTVNGDLQIVETSKREGIVELVGTGTRFLCDGDKKRAMNNAKHGLELLVDGYKHGGRDTEARKIAIETRTTEADVIQFSGCKEQQTSADASINGQATGAMTYALIQSLKKDTKNQTYTELLRNMRQELKGKYSQVPMMSAGRKLVMEHPFSI